MNWRFTILDRNNIATVIDEPVGWDANISEINRNLDYHGIFFANQGETFEFYEKAMQLLKAEYDQYGAEGIMFLLMEEDCGNGYEEFDRAKFVFTKYEYDCGDTCYVKIPAETTSEVMNLRNRLNQKVNLETLKAFDETTDLPVYDKLPFTLQLPSKGIFIQNNAVQDANIKEIFNGGVQTAPTSGCEFNASYLQIPFGINKTIASEIGNFSCPTALVADQLDPGVGFVRSVGAGLQPIALYPLNLTPILNYAEGSPNYGDISNPVKFKFGVEAVLYNKNCYIPTIAVYLLRLPEDLLNPTNGENEADYEFLYENIVRSINIFSGCPTDGGYSEPGITNVIRFTEEMDVVINPGDRFYFFAALTERKSQAQIDDILAFGSTDYAFSLEVKTQYDGTYFINENLSKTSASNAKVFAINEVISRVTEAITNNKLKAYSEYFGRTDSEPYSVAEDGCGSLEVVTDGIRIRNQQNKIPGKTNLFTLSLQDVFEGLNSIHNIGMGLEPDTNRSGYNRLRIEPWKYFYNDTVVMSCSGVNKITRKVYDRDIFSTFQFGYAKWEAEEYTGLDEFLTKRNYRTTLSQIKNDFIKLSKFIASGYALEITRRKGENNSKDWRYDKDAFIICIYRGERVVSEGIVYSATFEATGITLIGATTPEDWQIIGNYITVTGAVDGANNIDYLITGVSVAGASVVLTTFPAPPVTQPTPDSINVFPLLPEGLRVELGNVSSPANIIDPDTLYNYRISPIRNAMRWANRIFESYKQFDSSCKILFTDGDGNYFAEGEMIDLNCKLEAGVISENQTIGVATFADPDGAAPFAMAERIVFDYPMSSKDYKNLMDNPYGLVVFDSNCEEGQGWIDSIKYKPEAGLATFNLIPKKD